jgi:hypothetical protein
MTLPTAKDITNLYLYAQLNAPNNLLSDSLIRPKIIPKPELQIYIVNTQEFMTSGAGRFAVGANFNIIQQFFDTKGGALAANNTAKPFYTKTEIAAHFGLTAYGWNMQQYNYQDSKDDYAERSYIFNTMEFQVNKDARFVIDANRNVRIENFKIIPREDTQENFDFAGGGLAVLVNPLIEPRIDPSHIGRTVNINFDNSTLATNYDYNKNGYYDASDYAKEKTLINSWKGLDLIKLTTDVNNLINNLWNDGTTKFLTADERPILYGTDVGDTLNSDVLRDSSLPTLAVYAKNGVVIIGGNGNDTFVNSTPTSYHNDIFDGGDGIDTVLYSSFLSGKNIVISERASIPILPSGNASTHTSQEIDLIINVEKIQATNNSDNLDIILLTSTKVQEIHTGAGADTVSVSGASAPYLKIYLEGGDDILKSAPRGAIVYGGSGNDTFALGQDYLVADAEAGDKFTYFGKEIYGGTRWRGQESADAKGLYGIKYERSTSGELIIIDPNDKQTFVSNFNLN